MKFLLVVEREPDIDSNDKIDRYDQQQYLTMKRKWVKSIKNAKQNLRTWKKKQTRIESVDIFPRRIAVRQSTPLHQYLLYYASLLRLNTSLITQNQTKLLTNRRRFDRISYFAMSLTSGANFLRQTLLQQKSHQKSKQMNETIICTAELVEVLLGSSTNVSVVCNNASVSANTSSCFDFLF